MLREWKTAGQPDEEELKERLKAAEKKLEVYQLQMKEHRLPVLVLVEGWGAAGKGSLIGKVIRSIDPRFFRVAAMADPGDTRELMSQRHGRVPSARLILRILRLITAIPACMMMEAASRRHQSTTSMCSLQAQATCF